MVSHAIIYLSLPSSASLSPSLSFFPSFSFRLLSTVISSYSYICIWIATISSATCVVDSPLCLSAACCFIFISSCLSPPMGLCHLCEQPSLVHTCTNMPMHAHTCAHTSTTGLCYWQIFIILFAVFSFDLSSFWDDLTHNCRLLAAANGCQQLPTDTITACCHWASTYTLSLSRLARLLSRYNRCFSWMPTLSSRQCL